MWMFSTVNWAPQAELDTLAKKADSLSPVKVKAKLLTGGKFALVVKTVFSLLRMYQQ